MNELILKRKKLPEISYTYEQGDKNLCILYLHGWGATRDSKKGAALAETAKKTGCSYLALDYTAHGKSGGNPSDFTVGTAYRDVMDVIQNSIGDMPLIIVGNSLGGWLGLLVIKKLKSQVRGFLGLAPAPDITQYVWEALLPDVVKQAILGGNIIGPSPETMGFCFTKELFEDGEKHFVLNKPLEFNGCVRLLLGDNDNRVDLKRLVSIKDTLTSNDVAIIYLKGANHHLLEHRDLIMTQKILSQMIGDIYEK